MPTTPVPLSPSGYGEIPPYMVTAIQTIVYEMKRLNYLDAGVGTTPTPGSTLPVSVPFNTVIDLDSNKSMGSHLMTGNVVFSVGAVAEGGMNKVEIVPAGGFTVDLSAFTLYGGSEAYSQAKRMHVYFERSGATNFAGMLQGPSLGLALPAADTIVAGATTATTQVINVATSDSSTTSRQWQLSSNNGSTWTTIVTNSLTSYTFTSLTASTAYQYRTYPISSAGTGPTSNVLTISTSASGGGGGTSTLSGSNAVTTAGATNLNASTVLAYYVSNNLQEVHKAGQTRIVELGYTNATASSSTGNSTAPSTWTDGDATASGSSIFNQNFNPVNASLEYKRSWTVHLVNPGNYKIKLKTCVNPQDPGTGTYTATVKASMAGVTPVAVTVQSGGPYVSGFNTTQFLVTAANSAEDVTIEYASRGTSGDTNDIGVNALSLESN